MTATEQPAQFRRSFVQELGLDIERGDDSWTGEALVPPGAWAPGTRFPRTSVLATYVDVIAGVQARSLTLPQLSVTTDVNLDLLIDDVAAVVVEEVSVRSQLLRQGKRLFVTESLFSWRGRPIAAATASFSAISRTRNAFGDAIPEPRTRFQRQLLAQPVTERVGLESPEPGVAQLDRRAELGNSTDSLMGGLTMLLGECAALSEAEAHTGQRHVVQRLLVRYLAPVRVGPARAEVTMAAEGLGARIARVSIRDMARPAELAADVTLASVPLD